MAELKPCPFCGAKFPDLAGSLKERRQNITCFKCDAEGPPAFCDSPNDFKGAIAAWNRRSDDKQ